MKLAVQNKSIKGSNFSQKRRQSERKFGNFFSIKLILEHPCVWESRAACPIDKICRPNIYQVDSITGTGFHHLYNLYFIYCAWAAAKNMFKINPV